MDNIFKIGQSVIKENYTKAAFWCSAHNAYIEEQDGQYIIVENKSLPQPTYAEKRASEYPSIADQLDMIYWDKVNGTNVWAETVAAVKAKYPKPDLE